MEQRKALQAILAQLLAQPEIRQLLEDAAEGQDGSLQLILANAGADLDSDHVREILEELLNSPMPLLHAQQMLEQQAMEGPESLVGVVALILNAGMEARANGGSLRRPRTLRESIDSEWPW